MTATEVKDYAKMKLGDGVVNVELSSTQVDDALADALRWFSTKKGLRAYSSFDTTVGETEYSVESGANSVLEVVFTEESSTYSGSFNHEIFGNDYLPDMNTVMYSTFVLGQQAITDRKMITGSDNDWFYDQPSKKLNISPPPTEVQKVGYYYIKDIADSDIPNLLSYDVDLILRYTLASARMTLGRIRAKFGSGFETVAGSVSLDGDTLISDSKEEFEALNEEIRDTQEPMGIIVA